MRTLALIVAAAALVLPATAAPLTAKSSITAVTVYGDRALVTRTATVELAPGTWELAFEDLPASLADQSLQSAGRGEATATILDTTARQVFVENTPNERIRVLEDERGALQREVRVLDDRGRIVGKQLDYIERILALSTTPPPTPAAVSTPAPRTSIAEWRELQGYYEETLGRFAVEQQDLDRQREQLGLRQAMVEKQLGELRGAPGGRSQKVVTVRFETAYAGPLQVSITYAVPNASWRPAYDARLRSATRSIELSYFGVVRQNTGEDWTNVALTLSTARPSLGGAAPQLAQWILNVANPERKDAPGQYSSRGSLTAQGGADGFGAQRNFYANHGSGGDTFGVESHDFGRGPNSALFGAEAPAEAQMALATINARMTSATFRITSPATIPANNSAQKVAIASGALEATLAYHTAPKLSEAAFLAATATNTSEYPLLAGPMNAFLDDTFIATSGLRTVMPGEKFDLALGVDDGIAVKRRTVTRFLETTGLSNTGRRVTYEFQVTLTNNKKTVEKVTLREPLPVSRDEPVVVKLLQPTERDLGTAEKPREISREATGALAWELALKPGEKREIALKFSVDHPAEVAVAGLE